MTLGASGQEQSSKLALLASIAELPTRADHQAGATVATTNT
jgi:hypothetical protein